MTITATRRRGTILFIIGMTLIIFGLIANPMAMFVGLIVYLAGLAACTFSVATLTRGIRKENLNPNEADEYQLTHIVAGQKAALTMAYTGFAVLMTALFLIPILVLAPLPVATWAEIVRSAGMLAGGLILTVSFVQLNTIAGRMAADERAELASA